MQRPPSHIVVFKKRSESNSEMLRDTLHAVELQSPSGRRHQRHFAPQKSGAPATIMFERLGAAAAELDETDVESFSKSNEVSGVFANEIRRIPVPIRSKTSVETGQGVSDVASYLTGVRDGLNLALETMLGADEADLSAQRLIGPRHSRLTTDGVAWPLQMLGIGPNYRLTGRGVTVAVLDTGVDLDHPDFKSRFGPNDTRNFVDHGTVDDHDGHGTHCAGVAAGPLRPHQGARFSVAPDAKLIVGRVLGINGGYDSWILDGIDWALEEGARVISMSLSSSRPIRGMHAAPYEQVASLLLEESPGVLLLAAAGNSGPHSPVENPAACPSIFAVGAVDRNGKVAEFSCRKLDVAEIDGVGPGVDVRSCTLGGRYELMSGTSMATPHLAGLAALHWEAQPQLSAKQVWERLVSHVRNLGEAADYGAGLSQAP